MKVENLNQPIWLLFDDFKRKQNITYMHYIQVATKLALKEKALVGAYLVDGTNKVFRINEMIDLGNYNAFWKFDWINPMRKIDLVLEGVSDSETLKKALASLNNHLEEL